MKIETLAVHAGRRVDPATGAVGTPIHLSTTFERDPDGSFPRGHLYARNSNPTREALVMYATTKYLAGHGDVLGGALVTGADDALWQRIRRLQIFAGAVPSPFDCW